MKIRMKKPASWPNELWRESLPMGNGRLSAMLVGAAAYDCLYVNHTSRWEGESMSELPDVSDTLPEARRMLKNGEYESANRLLSETLTQRGFRSPLATPMAPACLSVRLFCASPYTGLERTLDLETGEAFVRYTIGEMNVEKRAFVSFADDTAYFEMRADCGMRVKIDPCENLTWDYRLPDGGTSCLVDGVAEIEDARRVLIRARFGGLPECASYDEAFARHKPLFAAAMGDAKLSLSDGDRANETLLDDAMNAPADCELFQKMWAYGRYLFVCGTAEGGNPFPLYGLWNGQAKATWAQNVANENVQMIYWHAAVGGLSERVKPLIDYYFGKMDAFRETARKLFGCRGICVSVYTTPLDSYPAPHVPVIVNYISVAGWLCRHFYDYYRYTGDEETFRAKILPFMLETAAFYEDYVERDERGRILLMPSVSPENTPGNFMPHEYKEKMGHVNPVVWNATMEIAIMKDLLTHLVNISETEKLDAGRVKAWKEILRDIPPYMVNSDGAIKEWMDEKLDDFYYHRHLSHIYPVFPGDEIGSENPLMPAFERAVDLRELQGQCSWSFTHMAAIYARFGRGERAAECLDAMFRSCVLSNLFTVSNDWRDMGVTMKIPMWPVQLDAVMGTVNAIQEMLFRVIGDEVRFLPAKPARMEAGSAENWRFPGGRVYFSWTKERFEAQVTAERNVCVLCVLPDGTRERLALRAGETRALECGMK